MTGIILILFMAACVWVIVMQVKRIKQRRAAGESLVDIAAGNMRRPEMVCPHCQTKGSVLVSKARRKSGLSGGKATGAVLTGGVSVLATGLSRKQSVQACQCTNCGMKWDVA